MRIWRGVMIRISLMGGVIRLGMADRADRPEQHGQRRHDKAKAPH